MGEDECSDKGRPGVWWDGPEAGFCALEIGEGSVEYTRRGTGVVGEVGNIP